MFGFFAFFSGSVMCLAPRHRCAEGQRQTELHGVFYRAAAGDTDAIPQDPTKDLDEAFFWPKKNQRKCLERNVLSLSGQKKTPRKFEMAKMAQLGHFFIFLTNTNNEIQLSAETVVKKWCCTLLHLPLRVGHHGATGGGGQIQTCRTR